MFMDGETILFCSVFRNLFLCLTDNFTDSSVPRYVSSKVKWSGQSCACSEPRLCLCHCVNEAAQLTLGSSRLGEYLSLVPCSNEQNYILGHFEPACESELSLSSMTIKMINTLYQAIGYYKQLEYL